jgi:hydrogenase-4 component F
MYSIFFITSFLIGGALLFNRNNILKVLLLVSFIILQGSFVFFVVKNTGSSFGYLTADHLAVIFIVVLFIISSLSIYHSAAYLKWQQKNEREHNFYYAAMVILVAALNCAYCANHIAITWMFVEITTIAASFLIYYRRTELTLEATWKYIFVCTISITFVFIGILFLGISMKHAGLTEMTYTSLMANAYLLNPFWTKMAFIFIFTGFTAKAALFPMYTAGIDAKDKAPSPAGAIFASGLMNVGFCGIFRTYCIVQLTDSAAWSKSVLLISATISIFLASVYIMKVANYKRMLAYSSIEHMGLVMLGLSMGGAGVFAAIFHLLLHSFIKPALFYQTGIAYRVFGSKMIEETGGYFRQSVAGSLVFILGYFCVTAVPPSGLFISEFMIFREMYLKGYLWLMAIIMMLLTVIIWALGRNIFRLVFTAPPNVKFESLERPSPLESLSQIALILFVMFMGIFPPEPILDYIRAAAAIVSSR